MSSESKKILLIDGIRMQKHIHFAKLSSFTEFAYLNPVELNKPNFVLQVGFQGETFYLNLIGACLLELIINNNFTKVELIESAVPFLGKESSGLAVNNFIGILKGKELLKK